MKGIQAVLGFPELEIMKPSDTRWLSHKCCIKGNLQGTASIVVNSFTVIRVIWRCCGICTYSLLASINGASGSYLLSEVLSALALIHPEEDS